MTDQRAAQRQRERLLYRYHNALDRGDFTTVADVLAAAGHDAELARMIESLNDVLTAEARPAILPGRQATAANGRWKTDNVELQEEQIMTTNLITNNSILTAGRAAPHIHGRLQRHWQAALPLLAALIVVILLTGLLALNAADGGSIPVGGPGDSPVGLPGAAQQSNPTPTQSSVPLVTATATIVMPVTQSPVGMPPVITATITDPTVLPPYMTPMVGSSMGMFPPLLVGITMTGALSSGQDVIAYSLVADQADQVRLIAVSSNFTPRLLAILLDNDAEVLTGDTIPNQSILDIPPIQVGDRVLILLMADSGDTGGQFMLSAAYAE